MVFTSNELQKGRVSDYEIGPDRCNPTKVTGQFPTYIIAFDCKPGDNTPYTTNEQTNYDIKQALSPSFISLLYFSNRIR